MEAVEEHAARVLERVPTWLWDGETLPVPVEDIADSVLGLLVRDVDDLGAAPGAPQLAPEQELSGLLLAARGEIWVNAREARTWPTRRRFTIGHELGHWEMHRDGQTALFCRSTTVDEDQRPAVPDLEEEASRFAAALLMPQWLMVREHARLGDDLDRMCKKFRTSGVAMGRRMDDLFGTGRAWLADVPRVLADGREQDPPNSRLWWSTTLWPQETPDGLPTAGSRGD